MILVNNPLRPAQRRPKPHPMTCPLCTADAPLVSVPVPGGTEIEVIALGAGPITITAVAGVMLNGVMAGSADINAQWQGAVLRKYAADTWLIIGAIGDVT